MADETPFITKYGVFLHMKTQPKSLDKFTRFHELRIYRLLTDFTK